MKTIKLLALTSAAALLAACGTTGGNTNGNWKEVTAEEYVAKITAVEDYQPAKAAIHLETTTSTVISGEGDMWESYASLNASALSDQQQTSSETKDINITYTEDGWVADNPEVADDMDLDQIVQYNKEEMFPGLLPSSEEGTEETEDTSIDLGQKIKFFTGKGYKTEGEMTMPFPIEGMTGEVNIKATQIFDEKAWPIKIDSTTLTTIHRDVASPTDAETIAMSITYVTTAEMHASITYSGVYTAPEATAA